MSKIFEVDEKTKKQEAARTRFSMHLFKNMYTGAKIPWGRFVIALILSLVTFFISGSSSGLTAQIASGDFSDIGAIIKYVAISILALSTVISGIVLDFALYTLNTRVKSSFWKKLLRLPMEYFDKESPNRLISRLTSDSDAAFQPFGMISMILTVLAMGVGVVFSSNGVFATPMAKWLIVGCLAMLLTVFAAILLLIYGGFIGANRLSTFTSYLSERMTNFKLIKASCSEKEELELARQMIDNRYKADKINIIAIIMNYASGYVLLLFAYIGCFLLGYKYYASGEIASGQSYVMFYTFAQSMITVVLLIGAAISVFGNSAGQGTAFAKIYDEKEEDLTTGQEISEESQDIVLKDIAFSYDDTHEVLKNIDCVIKKGEVTAIVGGNGSGKSTLVKIIDRLYTDVNGAVCFGDKDAKDITLSSWRDRLGIVSQNAGLFSGTIRSNICYGVEQCSDEKLEKICQLTGVDEILSDHDGGLDYEVGIGGCRLSGGEQQRIALARAMMKDPDYLILDEATANLDNKTSREIWKSIHAVMKGRTVIMIAHDYHSIKIADHLIVLNAGRIVDSGTHEELMERCEFYQQLYRAGFEV